VELAAGFVVQGAGQHVEDLGLVAMDVQGGGDSGRLAPLVQVLQQAAAGDAALGALWQEITERRAANMRLFAAELARTGELRPGLPVAEAADVLWSMNSPEFYLLLVSQRGWDPDRYQQWLADAWQRLLLEAP
jgi:hypothetical protein